MSKFRVFFAIVLGGLGFALPAAAQSCDNYRVEARLLNMRAEPNVFGNIIDVLRQDEIVCLSKTQSTSGQDWGLVVTKSRPDGSGSETVEGWTSLRYLSKMETPPSDPGADQPVAGQPQPQPTDDAALPGTVPEPEPAQLNFAEPVPFGPFPVRGRSLEQLANSLPLFSPIDGLPDTRWKKQCTSCHQWNKDRLCDQGKSYAASPVNIIRIQHPYGGPYKKALATWAKSGCN
ncbi:SH3 domain-containing protein [Aurantimonas sp. VKM B-3413]|uniref:SH3 domain-containing protein n=1 Tax=Aurantimonas sp. VKM B-3413 TaxID=2779401 RepID=UPI001E33668E|nr:SH3 domain-containing protein [Aurantimonas sp. VKM B-3413]MCB8837760.1 SH3 domain-containing protein [Aurantimonas sp. VKM B-3413]